MAEWKTISGYTNYEVSDEGEVRNHKTGRLIKPSLSRGGYKKVNLRSDGIATSKKVHRLVAETFIPNIENKSTVNHIDGDKSNNVVGNLEWNTHSENNKHAFDSGLSYRPVNSGVAKRRVAIAETGVIFDSVSDCARYLGASESNVSACLSGRCKTCRGQSIIYVDDRRDVRGEQA